MFKKDRFLFAAGVMALLVLAGCGKTMGPPGTDSPGYKEFTAYFENITPFGNYDVSNSLLATGEPDDQYAIVETHGSITFDIGQGRSFHSSTGPDLYIYMPADRPANYTVHVRHESHGEENWIEIGRGRGPEEFDFYSHYTGPANFLQIRNEGTSTLYIDAIKAMHVKLD